MKTSITCDDEYEAQKLMSLIFIKEDKEYIHYWNFKHHKK